MASSLSRLKWVTFRFLFPFVSNRPNTNTIWLTRKACKIWPKKVKKCLSGQFRFDCKLCNLSAAVCAKKFCFHKFVLSPRIISCFRCCRWADVFSWCSFQFICYHWGKYQVVDINEWRFPFTKTVRYINLWFTKLW
jgi:hypothetical protein